MASKKIKELKGLSPAELEEKMVSMKDELAKEKAQISSGTRAENPGKIKKIRRNIARILTLINEKSRQPNKKEEKETKKTKTPEKKTKKKAVIKKKKTKAKKKAGEKKRGKKTKKHLIKSRKKKKKGGNEKK